MPSCRPAFRRWWLRLSSGDRRGRGECGCRRAGPHSGAGGFDRHQVIVVVEVKAGAVPIPGGGMRNLWNLKARDHGSIAYTRDQVSKKTWLLSLLGRKPVNHGILAATTGTRPEKQPGNNVVRGAVSVMQPCRGMTTGVVKVVRRVSYALLGPSVSA